MYLVASAYDAVLARVQTSVNAVLSFWLTVINNETRG